MSQRSDDIKQMVREFGPTDGTKYTTATIDRSWSELDIDQKYVRSYAAATFAARIIGRMAASSDMGYPEIMMLLDQDDGEEEDDDADGD